MARHEENVETLRQMLPAPLLGDIPFLPHWDATEAANYPKLQLLIEE
jgi:hypothetical protein